MQITLTVAQAKKKKKIHCCFKQIGCFGLTRSLLCCCSDLKAHFSSKSGKEVHVKSILARFRVEFVAWLEPSEVGSNFLHFENGNFLT